MTAAAGTFDLVLESVGGDVFRQALSGWRREAR